MNSTPHIPLTPWRAGACLPAFRDKMGLSHYITSEHPQEDSDAIGFTNSHAHGDESAAAVARLWAMSPEILEALGLALLWARQEPLNDAARAEKSRDIRRALVVFAKAKGVPHVQ